MTKKVIRNFRRENGNLFRKNVIQKPWSARNFSVPPKVGARSPPLMISVALLFLPCLGLALSECKQWQSKICNNH